AGPLAVELDELVIAVAHDQAARPLQRVHPRHHADGALDAFVVRIAFPAVPRPLGTPLLLETSAVGAELLGVVPCACKLAERRLAEVMDKRVLGADDAISQPPEAQRVVVVLEQADAEPLVEEPGSIDDVA